MIWFQYDNINSVILKKSINLAVELQPRNWVTVTCFIKFETIDESWITKIQF